jgi:O-antigen ligase
MEIIERRPVNSKTIFITLICFFFAGLFFSTVRVSNVGIVLLLAFAVFTTPVKDYFIILRNNKFALALLAVFILQLIGLLYTSNFKTGSVILEKRICFLFFPLIILPSLTRFGSARDLIIRYLGIITLASSVILLIIASYRKFILGNDNAFMFESFRNFEGFSPIHYVYYALIFACGFFFFVNSFFETIVSRKFGLYWLVLLFLYAIWIMVLVASKTGIGIFLVTTALFLFYKIENKKLYSICLVFLFVGAAAFLLTNETTRDRFTGLGTNIEVLKEEVLVGEFKATGLNMRLLFWKINLKHLVEDNLFYFGVGTGDAQDYINALYNLPQYELWGYLNWDSHNQWVFSLVQLGIPAVVLLALVYGLAAQAGRTNRDLFLLTFLLITFSFSLSESILELNKGILFFSLCYLLLTLPYTQKKVS